MAGRRILVVEAGGNMGQAWRAAAGMLAPQIEADAGDPLFELGIAARDHYQPLATTLLETTGMDLGLWQDGIARVASSDAEADELRPKVAWQQRQGHACDWLDAGEVSRRWPWLNRTSGALWAARDGALDPERLVLALLTDARRLGAHVVTDRAVRIDLDAGRVTGVTGQAGHYTAEEVVIAAGAWSGQVEGLPRPLPVQPVRGQMAALPWPASIPPAIIYSKDGYLVARGGEAIIGSTMEHVGFKPEITAAGLAQVIAATMLLCPSLARAKVRRSWAGLRPITPDGLPIIGADPLLRGLWYATGYGRNGILLAGLTGVLVRQLMDGEAPVQDLRAFAPDRF